MRIGFPGDRNSRGEVLPQLPGSGGRSPRQLVLPEEVAELVIAEAEVARRLLLVEAVVGESVGEEPRLEAAHAFLDWLAGPEGAAVLATFGFLPVT